MDLNQIVNGVVIQTTASIKPHGDTDKSKTIHLLVKFDGVKLVDVFNRAAGGTSTKVTWVNGVGRPKWDSLKNGETITVNYKAPNAIDPETAIKQKLAGMTKDEKAAYIESLLNS